MADVRKVSVIGAGLMGHAIALTFARAGFAVSIFDPQPESLRSVKARVLKSLEATEMQSEDAAGVVGRIALAQSLEECVGEADFVTEAAPEKLELKQAVFRAVEQAAPASAILASNTSVIPITRIMGELRDRSRTVGTHWWNPGHLIPLVEVIRTEKTSDETMQATADVLKAAGKTPVFVQKDVPGFIGNRLQHALWREAICLVERGICAAEDVDTVVKSSFGRRLSVLGPLENADLVGTDLTLDIHNNILFDLESSPHPSPYLEELVGQQKYGMRSGRGFRTWTAESAQAVKDRLADHLLKLERILRA